jgi:hypothetical protein
VHLWYCRTFLSLSLHCPQLRVHQLPSLFFKPFLSSTACFFSHLPASNATYTMANTMDVQLADNNSANSASSSDEEQTPLQKAPATYRVLSGTVVEVWSAMEARILINIPFSELMTGGERFPDHDKLETLVRAALPTTASPVVVVPGRLDFIHVSQDETGHEINTGITSQEVLKLEWEDWRIAKPGSRKFYLWVRDHANAHRNSQMTPQQKKYHPHQTTTSFVKLPLSWKKVRAMAEKEKK